MSSVSSVNTLLSSTSPTTPTVNISSILAAASGTSTPGIDVTSAVAAAIYADNAPERVWEADQTTLTTQSSDLTAIQTATQAVETDLQALNTLNGPLSSRTVATSNSNEVTATATDGTTLGDHTVIVNSVATTGTWYSSEQSSATSTLPTGSFTLNTNAGASVTFQTGAGTSGDTLSDLAAAINSATTSSGASLGVTATVVSDSTGSTLAIVANQSGAASDFSVSEPYTSWSAPVMSSGETLGANSITMTSATTPPTTATIATTAGETYAQLADAINAVTPSLGVTAMASTDSSGNQSLTIASNDGTTPFTINEPSSSGSAFSFTQAVQGADAQLTVDGVPIDSASNTVTGAIPGVTLTLLGANPDSEVTLGVQSDASSVATAINQFVSDYNTAIGLVNAQYTVTSSTNSSGATTSSEGVLASDPTVSSLQSALEQATAYNYTPASGTTTVSNLSDLGITVNSDGTLSVDSTTLDNALTNNPTDVQNFFEGAALNGFASSLGNTLNTYTEPANGAFTVDLNSMSTESSNLTSEINNFETGYIANQQTILTAEYSSAEIALQQLPQQMEELNSELGFTNNGSSNG
jgi:flagellar hook-associated protein 2